MQKLLRKQETKKKGVESVSPHSSYIIFARDFSVRHLSNIWLVLHFVEQIFDDLPSSFRAQLSFLIGAY